MGQILQGYTSWYNKEIFSLESGSPKTAIGLCREIFVNRNWYNWQGPEQVIQMIKGMTCALRSKDLAVCQQAK